MSWLYLWANSLAEGNTDGDLMMYDFDVTDAHQKLQRRRLVKIWFTYPWSQEMTLSWSSIAVQISVDGGYYNTCTNPDQASDTGCAISDNDDGIWGFGEDVTISEGSDDLCESSCEVQIRIIEIWLQTISSMNPPLYILN